MFSLRHPGQLFDVHHTVKPTLAGLNAVKTRILPIVALACRLSEITYKYLKQKRYRKTSAKVEPCPFSLYLASTLDSSASYKFKLYKIYAYTPQLSFLYLPALFSISLTGKD